MNLAVKGVPQEFVLEYAFDGSIIFGEIVFHKAFSAGLCLLFKKREGSHDVVKKNGFKRMVTLL